MDLKANDTNLGKSENKEKGTHNIEQQKSTSGSVFFLSFVTLILILLLLIYGWPTRYRYDHYGDILLRIDRFNGDIEVFYFNRGWVPVESESIRADRFAAEEQERQEKIAAYNKKKQEKKQLEISQVDDQQSQQKATSEIEFLESKGVRLPKEDVSLINATCALETTSQIKCWITNNTNKELKGLVLEIDVRTTNGAKDTFYLQTANPINSRSVGVLFWQNPGIIGIFSTAVLGASV